MFELSKVNAVFADFYRQLEEAKKVNEQTVFDYESIKGNKDARSYVYKLRQSKAAIEKKRKEAKSDALKFGKELDTEAKKITSEVEGMIDVHEKPLKEIENREKERIANIQEKIANIRDAGLADDFGTYKVNTSTELQYVYDALFNMTIDNSFAEFKTVALEMKDGVLKRLVDKIAEFKKEEAEKTELERLRKESVEREQKEHDERIAREAKEQAERKAHKEKVRAEFEAKAEKERIEREKKEAIEAAEREKQQAIENAERAKREQIAQEERAKLEKEHAVERQRIAVEEAKQAQINAQKEKEAQEQRELETRERNKRHIGNIRKQAKESIMQLGFTEAQAKQLVLAIHADKITNVKINY